MNRFSSVRVRLVGIVFLATALPLAVLFYTHQRVIWTSFAIGLLALVAAWVGGELFVLRQLKSLINAAKGLAKGDLSTRTGLLHDPTELGDLARTMDALGENLERQIEQRERTEKTLVNRALQQTVVAALGQFALVASDLAPLLNQAVMLVSQTLEVEYCDILEMRPDGNELILRAGLGWKEGRVGTATVPAGSESQAGYTLLSGEPVVVQDLRTEKRFPATPLLEEHGVASGVTVVIPANPRPYGVLGVHTSRQRAFTEDEVHFLVAVGTLVAMAVDRQRTEPEIQKLAAFAKFNPNPVLEISSDGGLTFFNDAAQKMADLLGAEHLEDVLPPDTVSIVQTCLATGMPRLHLETRPAGRILSWSFYPITSSQAVHCYVEDTTEHTNLEEQFRQAQKMESVGQLAAGVAHDFNNILTIIQGHSGLLMARANLSPAMVTSVQAVSFAAERASSLTRQLLMFSRKQVMQPKAIDLKEIVSNMSKMLQRLIGETVQLSCESPAQLPPVKGDTGMMEQILMNLAVNARDAMPKGGELLITTSLAQIDERYVKSHRDASVGTFVCLQVRDNGTGMDAATMKRIFEPFFTTKGGKGTGLGLATVYGIVRQHSGWIEVYSRVGEGTTFKIFLPAETRPAEEHTQIFVADTPVRGGGETILVVEDEPVLRDLAQLILQDCGYRVLPAESGVEALTVWQKQHGAIDLLLTDMIMPDGLSGKDLAESLLGHKPKLKVIFMSGYNVEEFGSEDTRKNGTKFLQKPYSRFTLAKAVRDCLDS